MSVHGSSGVGEEIDQAHQGLVCYLCSTRSPLRGQGSMKNRIYTVRETVPLKMDRLEEAGDLAA